MKSSVFRSRRNEDGRWQLRSGAGSEFHADDPATAKLRGPYRTVLVTGTARSPRAGDVDVLWHCTDNCDKSAISVWKMLNVTQQTVSAVNRHNEWNNGQLRLQRNILFNS